MMKFNCKKHAILAILGACLMQPYFAFAIIDVDMTESDEVVISNTATITNATFSLAEPAQPAVIIVKSPIKTALPYHAEVQKAAIVTNLDPALIHAVIAVESKHQAHAKSKKGALGLMQLMPHTAQRFNVSNQRDPQQNIMAGAKYLRELINTFNGNISLGLAAYNAGPAAVKKYHDRIPPYKETQDYVPKVLSYYNALKS